MNRRLFDVAQDFLALEALLLESGGELTPEIETALAENTLALEVKVDGYAALIREWELEAEKWKAEEQRVAQHRRARENAAARLKARLVETMVELDRLSITTPRFKVAVQRSAPTVALLVEPENLPEQYRRTVVSVNADKVALKADIALGVEAAMNAATMTDGTPFLRIR